MVQSSKSGNANILIRLVCLFLLGLSLTLLTAGCATTVTPEDQDFFYKTWVHTDGITPIQ